MEIEKNSNGISIKNAGLVILSTYISLLFERIGLLNNKIFIDRDAQQKAVYYLQYVATGMSKTDESFLPLNKILCGLHLSHPLPEGITISDNDKKIIEGLIHAMMGYWPAAGNSSIDGFRGNWLVRDGLLIEKDDRWDLTVEKRAYDILIHQSPFSFSIIKYPWMEKPIHVIWTY